MRRAKQRWSTLVSAPDGSASNASRVPAGSALWTDYGDSYWEGDYHNHVKLIDSRVALAADVSKAHNGGASLGVKFDPPARARPAWLERKSKRGRSSESDGE